MNIRNIIREYFVAILTENNLSLDENLEDDTVLLNTGLDSLAFAVLVARLDELLGYDPFVLMEEPFYPRTFGDFIGIYEKYSGHLK